MRFQIFKIFVKISRFWYKVFRIFDKISMYFKSIYNYVASWKNTEKLPILKTSDFKISRSLYEISGSCGPLGNMLMYVSPTMIFIRRVARQTIDLFHHRLLRARSTLNCGLIPSLLIICLRYVRMPHWFAEMHTYSCAVRIYCL